MQNYDGGNTKGMETCLFFAEGQGGIPKRVRREVQAPELRVHREALPPVLRALRPARPQQHGEALAEPPEGLLHRAVVRARIANEQNTT